MDKLEAEVIGLTFARALALLCQYRLQVAFRNCLGSYLGVEIV